MKRPKWIAYHTVGEGEELVTITKLKYDLKVELLDGGENYPPPAYRLSSGRGSMGWGIPTGAVDVIMEARVSATRHLHRSTHTSTLWRSPSTLIRRAIWFSQLDFSSFFLRESWQCLSDALTLWASQTATIPEALVNAAEKADKCWKLSKGTESKHEACTALKHGVAIMLKLSEFIEKEEDKAPPRNQDSGWHRSKMQRIQRQRR